MKIKTFTISWFEYTIQEGKDLKNFMKTLPNSKIFGSDGDSKIIRCFDKFKAKDITEARKIVKRDYDGIDTAFSVMLNNKIIFTEEDI
jgi:hypothetical protein